MAKAEFRHCLNFYETMEKESGLDIKTELKEFVGRLGDIQRECRIPNAYYSAIVKGLGMLGCISIEERGSWGNPSRVYLIRPPTEPEWTAHRALTERPKGGTLLEKVDQRVQKIEKQLGGVESVINGLAELERQINSLRVKIDAIERKNGIETKSTSQEEDSNN